MNRFARFNNVAVSAMSDAYKTVAKVATDEENFNFSMSGGQYLYEHNDYVTSRIAAAESGEIIVDMLPSGKPVNRVRVMFGNNPITLRTYGEKGMTIPARPLTKEELKKADCGYCKDADGYIGEEIFDRASGEKKLRKYLYWKF